MRIGQIVRSGVFATAALMAMSGGVKAAVVYDAAGGASAYMGYIASSDSTLPGTVYNHPAYPIANILDGDLGTRSDTYSGTEISGLGSDTAPLDFVGVIWSGAVSDIVAVRLHQFTYFDGGWFGTQTGDTNSLNTATPGANTAAANIADAADVAAPTVQITTDFGVTWSAIAAIEDYVSIVQPSVAADFVGRIATPIDFAFASQSGINGIRLVGYGGGRSDISFGRDEQGWISVSEFEVGRFVADVPEPTTLTLLGAGLVGLGWARRRRLA